MKLKRFRGVFFFLFFCFVCEAAPNADSFFSYFKESCRGERGWHAEYLMSVEEKIDNRLEKLSGTVDLLVLCPSSFRFSFFEKNNFFEFISDSVQAWIIRQKKSEKFRRIEQYNSLSKRGLNSWLIFFSRALDSKESSFGDFSNFFNVERVKAERQKIKRFEIQHRKNLDKLTVDFGSDLEPRFDEILFQQNKYLLKLKFQKRINDEKSSDLKSYNFYARPGDRVTLFLDRAE